MKRQGDIAQDTGVDSEGEQAPAPGPATPDAFAYHFVAPKACQLSSEHLRRFISIDACHTTSQFGSILHIAVGYDANNEILPLACGVSTGEKYETWRWFLDQLCIAYPWLRRGKTALISDRQKGLIKAVKKEVLDATH